MISFFEFGVIFTFIYIFAIIAGFRCSSAVEQSPVKRLVAGSIPAAGASQGGQTNQVVNHTVFAR